MYKNYINKPDILKWYVYKILLIMRLTIVIIIATMLQVSASTYGQKITYVKKNVTLVELLKVIKIKTGYASSWAESSFDANHTINANFKNATLTEVLDKALEGMPVTYTIINNSTSIGGAIGIRVKNPDINPIVNSITVRGRLVDENNKPLEGAVVKVKGTSNAIATDSNGEFVLKNMTQDAVLIISFLGYETQEIKARENLGTIRMVLSSDKLQEVGIVSTGYQNIPKERLTGSFAQPNKEMFDSRVSTDVISKLDGITSGLVFNSPGITGSKTPKISIRGRSTIYANDDPLIVVDNFPYDGDINNINPNDVESVTILKDAAAASIWGVQAGNGVIVITTKKGRLNQPLKIQLNSNLTISDKPNLFYDRNYLDANNFIDLEKFLFAKGRYNADILQNNPSVNSSIYTPLSPVVVLLNQVSTSNGAFSQAQADQQIDKLRNNDVRNDLSKFFYQRIVNHQYSLNLRGGGPRNSYFVSAGYDKNEKIVVGNPYDRLTLNADNAFNPIPNLELTLGLNYVQSNIKTDNTLSQIAPLGPNGTVIYPYTQLADDQNNPLAIVRQYSSAFVQNAPSKGFLNWQFFPLKELQNGYNTGNTTLTDIRLNTGLKFTIIPGFSAAVKYQYERSMRTDRNIATLDSYATRSSINRYATVNTNGLVTVFNQPIGGVLRGAGLIQNSNRLRTQLSFDKVFNRNSITAIAGYEFSQVKADGNGYTLFGYDDDLATSKGVDPNTNYLLNPGRISIATIGEAPRSSGSINRFLNYFVNAAYTYNDKYTVSASGRIDASNYFGVNTNQKSVPLWSTGIRWAIDKEDFYKLTWLPQLKIRASYGFQGNLDKTLTAVTTFRYLTSAKYTNANYASISNYGNPDLRWEKTRMINVGIDFGLLRDILTGSLEYYTKKGIDLIGFTTLAPTSGLTDLKGNYAGTSGKGMDIQLNSKNIDKALKWTTSCLFSWTTDKVTSYKGTNITPSGLAGSALNISPVVGKPVFGVYALKSAGLDPQTGDPRGYDQSGNISKDYSAFINPLTLDQLIFKGNARPVFYGGINNRFTYKQFSLSVNVSYKLGYYFIRSGLNYDVLFRSGLGNDEYYKRWQKPGDEAITNVPSLVYPANSNRETFYTKSEALVERGDHIRLQDVSLSYDFDKRNLRYLSVNHIQIYLYANNLGLLWTANKERLDPDYPTGGIPNPKMWSLGVKVGL
ncbi:MAG: SusC/RagA family TonB-linked outer membrane protein [Candidatus Pedobacter colombiensis]|uniref:SusC/RagA family TonB-linked outer membrane protein n=1 Tax=Candidatus Pedobacter colombiensis TaxID=3121371 RepID=A0AAJ5W783_9SPHI|nr:SusC/RagA family TonB-linked outer membrane protein [Pedobacter sp.]WEK18403.1 MAG: SusC/RagA family TonB-linked outer membrane protein [Pedobacter sp.]